MCDYHIPEDTTFINHQGRRKRYGRYGFGRTTFWRKLYGGVQHSSVPPQFRTVQRLQPTARSSTCAKKIAPPLSCVKPRMRTAVELVRPACRYSATMRMSHSTLHIQAWRVWHAEAPPPRKWPDQLQIASAGHDHVSQNHATPSPFTLIVS